MWQVRGGRKGASLFSDFDTSMLNVCIDLGLVNRSSEFRKNLMQVARGFHDEKFCSSKVGISIRIDKCQNSCHPPARINILVFWKPRTVCVHARSNITNCT